MNMKHLIFPILIIFSANKKGFLYGKEVNYEAAFLSPFKKTPKFFHHKKWRFLKFYCVNILDNLGLTVNIWHLKYENKKSGF